MSNWWLCPLGQCPDGAIVHDGDGYDEELICCREGCDCRGYLDPEPMTAAPTGPEPAPRSAQDVIEQAEQLADYFEDGFPSAPTGPEPAHECGGGEVSGEYLEAVALGMYALHASLSSDPRRDWPRLSESERDLNRARARFVLSYADPLRADGAPTGRERDIRHDQTEEEAT